MTDASQPAGHSQWNLVLGDGPNAGQIFPVTGDTLTIGRELYNDIPLDDLHISKQHARLTRQGEQLLIEDLFSVNGTLVNDVPITEPYVLQPNDVIRLGPFTFRVEGPSGGRIPQTRIDTRAYPVPKPQPKPRGRLPIIGAILALIVIAAAVVIGGYWLITRDTQTAAVEPTGTGPALIGPAIEINQAPPNGSRIKINRSVMIQATAADSDGVTRMELWANGRRVDQVASQLAQDVPAMTAAFQWSADTPGPYTLEIRAYNRPGLANTVTVADLTVISDPPTPTAAPLPTPSPTITPLPPPPTSTPSPTASPTPTLILSTPTPRLAMVTINAAALNVRAGPGTQYNRVGQLDRGSQSEIVGQAGTGPSRWWQIRFDAAPDGLGWVSAEAAFSTAVNVDGVPVVAVPPVPTAAFTSSPTPTATPATEVIRAPSGKTLLIVSNRSLINQPARLTLSGGKSVGGGREIDVAPNSEIEIVLEPDFYRALWSSPYQSFTRGADFTAVAGKVMVMWIVPEDGVTSTEEYGELIINLTPPSPTPTTTVTPQPVVIDGYTVPFGKALFVAGNRSLTNVYALVTLSGGSFGGGQEITLDANTEIPLELAPGSYRVIWSTPGFTAGDEFTVTAGTVIQSWIIPENRQVYRQFPGQPSQLISN